MVLDGITLSPLAEELRAVDSGLISPYYLDYAAFDSSSRQSAQILNLSMERGLERVYFPEPAESLFNLETPG